MFSCNLHCQKNIYPYYNRSGGRFYLLFALILQLAIIYYLLFTLILQPAII